MCYFLWVVLIDCELTWTLLSCSLPLEKNSFVYGSCSSCGLCPTPYWFVLLIKKQVTASSRTPYITLLYFTHNESNAISSYGSPRSPIMTVTSTTIAAPITVTPIIASCPQDIGLDLGWVSLRLSLIQILLGLDFVFLPISLPVIDTFFIHQRKPDYVRN